MFHDITQNMRDRMRFLEAKDAADRADGTPHAERLRQVKDGTGRLLALLAASAPDGQILEVGTSGGYSTLWLALACAATGRAMTTFERSAEKADLARETFALCGVELYVELIEGDALTHLPSRADVAFCFLDAERSLLEPAFEMLLPKMVPGGFIVADNVISHKHEIEPFLAKIPTDRRVDSVIVTQDSGLLVCRKPL